MLQALTENKAVSIFRYVSLVKFYTTSMLKMKFELVIVYDISKQEIRHII